MLRFLFISIFCTFIVASIFCQTPEEEVVRYEDISIIENGATLSLPYAGGLNSPLYTEADINNDGVLDLFIYDRTDDSGNYILRSGPNDYFSGFEFQKNLPPLVGYALMYDYNCDDVPDLFTSTTKVDDNGSIVGADIIVVYQGNFDSNNELQFTLAKEKLTIANNQELFCLTDNIPSIVDLDSDGDLDILAFKTSAGKQVAFYKNLSMELYNNCDSLVFDLITTCYGEFIDNGIIPFSLDVDTCWLLERPLVNRHGVSSLLSFDNDNDGLYELMIGNEFYNTVTVLSNDGIPNPLNPDNTHFYKQDNSFPSISTPINIASLPTPSWVDVNMDGIGEILISNRSTAASQNYACTKVYQRDETDSFDLVLDTFLVTNMIDVGEEATPVFFDFDQDGLTDLLIGSSGYFNPASALDGGITAYKNIGDASNPAFQLFDRNFQNIEVYDWNFIAPTFGDLDGDGDEDMIIGEGSGKIHYFQNSAGPNNPVSFSTAIPEYQGIDIGKNAIPQIVDLNYDGLLDLVIGTQAGFLVYYPNNGTATNPIFDEQITQVGNVDTRYFGESAGYSAPTFSDLENSGEYILYAGSESGYIFRYNDIAGNLSAGSSFNEMTNSFADVKVGARSRIDLADIDNDNQVEMVVANRRGGIGIYKFGESVPTIDISNNDNYIVSPNPSSNAFYISGPNLNQATGVDVFTVDGKKVATNYHFVDNRIRIDELESLTTGLYFIEIQFDDKKITRKAVKSEF